MKTKSIAYDTHCLSIFSEATVRRLRNTDLDESTQHDLVLLFLIHEHKSFITLVKW
jgi:hypothetical protein